VAVVAASSLRSAAESARADEIERLRNTLYDDGAPSPTTQMIEAKPAPASKSEAFAELQSGSVSTDVKPLHEAPAEPKLSGGETAVAVQAKMQPAPAATKPARLTSPIPTHEREQIKEIIQDILDIRRGAFGPFSQTPLLRAVLIPFGSLGAVQLLQLLEGLL
jgi:hypothetical protein